MHRKQIFYKVKKNIFDKEMTFFHLDNEMENLGFDSVSDEFDELVLSSGSVSYLLEERENGCHDYIDISFDIVNDDVDDIGDSILKIKDIDII